MDEKLNNSEEIFEFSIEDDLNISYNPVDEKTMVAPRPGEKTTPPGGERTMMAPPPSTPTEKTTPPAGEKTMMAPPPSAPTEKTTPPAGEKTMMAPPPSTPTEKTTPPAGEKTMMAPPPSAPTEKTTPPADDRTIMAPPPSTPVEKTTPPIDDRTVMAPPPGAPVEPEKQEEPAEESVEETPEAEGRPSMNSRTIIGAPPKNVEPDRPKVNRIDVPGVGTVSANFISSQQINSMPSGSEITSGSEVVPKLSDQAVAQSALHPQVEGPTTHYPTYNMNGRIYHFKEIISVTSGEAEIFLVTLNGKDYVLKLYFHEIFPNMQLMGLIKGFGNTGLLVQVFDVGAWREPHTGFIRHFEIMEYITGGTLAEYNLRKDEERFKSIALQCAMALDFCHQNGFLHNDVKPSNFFFKDKTHNKILLADFGIAAFYDKETGECQTRQSRTPTFAAPEIYSFVIDNEIFITKKADFYSLGIVLLCLWSNVSTLVDNERLLVNKKRFGDLPYPEDMPHDLQQLVRGLTVVDPQKRWGFEEITRWFNGEEVAVERRRLTSMNILYKTKGNWIVNTPEDMANYMMQDQELAIKYLYSGKIHTWLNEGKIPELAMGIENIVEKKFPKNHEAGLFSAIYLLDPALPYRDINGEDKFEWEDIAQTLIDNIGEYKKLLTNPNNSLYIYLNSSGLESKSKELHSNFMKNGREIATWQMAYTLAPTVPYHIECIAEDDSLYYQLCSNIDDVIITVREKRLSDRGWNLIATPAFLTWLNNQNEPVIYKDIRNFLASHNQEDISYTYTVIYLLNRAVSFNLILPQEKGDKRKYIFSPADLGMELNMMLRTRYILKEKNEYAESNLDSLKSFYGSRIWGYLYSKGWEEQIKWIEACFDMEGPNGKKYSPYNEVVATYKTIKGLGYSPFYYLKDSKKYLFKLEDLKKTGRKELEENLTNGHLRDWLTTFFQEDPATTFEKKYDFEKTTIKYINFIRTINRSDIYPKKFYSAKRSVRHTRKSVNRKYLGSVLFRLLIGLIIILPMISGVLLLYFYPESISRLTLQPFATIPIIALSLFFFISSWFTGYLMNFKRSLIIGAISGLMMYYVFYFTFLYRPDFLPIIGYISLIVVGFFTVRAFYDNRITKNSSRRIFLSRDFDINNVEPLHYTFKVEDSIDFDSSVREDSATFTVNLRSINKELIKTSIGLIFTSFIIAFVIFDVNPQGREYLNLKDSVILKNLPVATVKEDQIRDEDYPTFDGKSRVERFDPDEVVANANTSLAHGRYRSSESSSSTVTKHTQLTKKDVDNIRFNLESTWSGAIDATEVSFSFRDFDNTVKRAVILVRSGINKYETNIYQGTIDITTRTLMMTSASNNNTLKGKIDGEFNQKFDTFVGKFTAENNWNSMPINLKLAIPLQ